MVEFYTRTLRFRFWKGRWWGGCGLTDCETEQMNIFRQSVVSEGSEKGALVALGPCSLYCTSHHSRFRAPVVCEGDPVTVLLHVQSLPRPTQTFHWRLRSLQAMLSKEIPSSFQTE